MNAWETQTDALRDIGDLLKKQMPDVTSEKHIDKGELESPNAGGVDWGLSCIHCFWVKKKIKCWGPAPADPGYSKQKTA